MKRFISALAILILLFPATTYAESSIIKVWDMDWFEPLSDFINICKEKNIISQDFVLTPDEERHDLREYELFNTQEADVEGGAYWNYISADNLTEEGKYFAGHQIFTCGIYSLLNIDTTGYPEYDASSSKVYKIAFSFNNLKNDWDETEAEETVNDLVSYISSLYGNPYFTGHPSEDITSENLYKWIDDENNGIVIDYYHYDDVITVKIEFTAYLGDEAYYLEEAFCKEQDDHPEKFESTAEPTEEPKKYLINKDGIELYLTDEYEVWGTNDTYLKVGVIFENSTDHTVKITPHDVAVDSWEVACYLENDEVASNRKARTAFNIKISDAGITKISDISQILFDFNVYNCDESLSIPEFKTGEVQMNFHN